MTGNTVLLGIGLASGDYAGAGRSAVALGGFVLGALCAGAFHAGHPDREVVARGFVFELPALAAALAWWLAAGDPPGFTAQHGLIGLVGIAMGVQSATVTRLGVGVSTTYITGTWTAVSRRAGNWVRRRGMTPPAPERPPRPDERTGRQALVLVVYFVAALGSGFAQVRAGAPAAAIPFGLLAITTAVAGTVSSRRR